MIIGTGLDIVEIERIEQLDDARSSRLAARILAEREKACYEQLRGSRKREFLAGRFAAKEAAAKAWGVGIGRFLSWRDMWVESDSLGKPVLTFSEPRKAELASLHRLEPERIKVHLSITHSQRFALAQVLLEASSFPK